MISLKNTTLVAAISSSSYIDDTIKSLKYNAKQVHFKDIQFIYKEMDYKYYSQWLLANLYHYIKTDYCLVVQWDSGIIDPEMWDDSFFEYDYIGAPWNMRGAPNDVGNGGFSLRSKKFLELSTKIAGSIPIDEFILGNEDYHACISCYNYMSQFVKFPDQSIARNFSVERSTGHFYFDPNNLDSYKSFGFHGDFNIAGMLKINGIL